MAKMHTVLLHTVGKWPMTFVVGTWSDEVKAKLQADEVGRAVCALANKGDEFSQRTYGYGCRIEVKQTELDVAESYPWLTEGIELAKSEAIVN